MAGVGCKYIHHMYYGYCGPGFVYIATNGLVYKIGMTKLEGSSNHVYITAGFLAQVHGRLMSLRRQSGEDFKIVRIIYTPICVRGFERYLHLLCDPYRIDKREWFWLDQTMIDFLLRIDSFDGHPLTTIEASI